MNTAEEDFGPFVKGPLDIPPSPSPALPHSHWFLAEAKANTDRNRKAILDEDDLLWFSKRSHSPPAPPIACNSTAHAGSLSWASTLHDNLPSIYNSLPSTKSFFSASHGNATRTGITGSISPPLRHSVLSSSTSFAPRVFVPIPGAPGFKPDEYDWDKGFSAALEHEAMIDHSLSSIKGKIQPSIAPPTSSTSASSTPSVKLGQYMEKKSGIVELIGRRLTTAPVLTSTVANKVCSASPTTPAFSPLKQIRPLLPALSRLQRSWSLVYSLDQHGISLKTLYVNCEAASTTFAKSKLATKLSGMVFVVKDTEGAVFGAWMSDGLRMSRGNEMYYGSGESFLWKWLEEEDDLRVFKWTGRNDYIALCEPNFISFGGGYVPSFFSILSCN